MTPAIGPHRIIDAVPDRLDVIDPGRLRLLNLVFGLAHLLQAVVFIVLSEDVDLDVTAMFASGPPGSPVDPGALEVLFSYPLGPAIALFSLLSAFFHLLIVSPWGWPRYVAELSGGQNRFRWVEYSLSASLMIVLIAGITGITDVAALVALFGVNASMILFGWLMETTNDPGRGADWSPYVFGCIAGIVPWIAIGVTCSAPARKSRTSSTGSSCPSSSCSTALPSTSCCSTGAIGRWADYLFGERIYVWLSLTAKSLLAWQIFANVLVS